MNNPFTVHDARDQFGSIGYGVSDMRKPANAPLVLFTFSVARAEAYAEKLNELRRRVSERNAGGYWGANARAWVPILIRELREARATIAGHMPAQRH